jgi:hypothetical protein
MRAIAGRTVEAAVAVSLGNVRPCSSGIHRRSMTPPSAAHDRLVPPLGRSRPMLAAALPVLPHAARLIGPRLP